jgi:hypothetical protein
MLALTVLGQNVSAQTYRIKHNGGYNNAPAPNNWNGKQTRPDVSFGWNNNQKGWKANQPQARIWPAGRNWNYNPHVKPAYKPGYVGNNCRPFRWRLSGCNSVGWYNGFPVSNRVCYRAVYPGIDLIYNEGYQFIVAPGADPYRIVLLFDGLNDCYLSGQGDLILQTAEGFVVQKQPYLYQEINGFRRPVSGYYVLRGNGRVGFEIGSYDTNFPLIIARR